MGSSIQKLQRKTSVERITYGDDDTAVGIPCAPLWPFSAQLPVQPLAFADIEHFLPNYDVQKRLAVYAIMGGIPAYLERWRARDTLAANIERLFLQRTG